ncbi:MAG: hypothetical protein AAF639_13090 [Chloroflexota bacterium]
MSLSIKNIEQHVLNMHTRIPFRYGIATLTALPHLFVSVTLEVNGKTQLGVASDGLAPKWFTKNPDTSIKHDLDEMFDVIAAACRHAQEIGEVETVFDMWQILYIQQKAWAVNTAYPPLLWNLGVSLVERAVIDAFCRATGTTFTDALRTNTLGIRLGEVHPELEGATPSDLLPAKPLRTVMARHTLGLGDPLTADDIGDDDRVDDGLPQALTDCIDRYGLRYYKIKIKGNKDEDFARLTQLAQLIEAKVGVDYRFTLDGNEQYHTVAEFQIFWEELTAEKSLEPFLQRLLFVEQPFHRAIALSAETGAALTAWGARPPMIIDESDGDLDSLPTALACGYVGTSHKNCKGVFKGIANACLLAHYGQQQPEQSFMLSGEDLCNVGPTALLQDLAVMASIGAEHVERNGHHYVRGLTVYPQAMQEAIRAAHPDAYQQHEDGFVALDINDGLLTVGSVVDAPFGVGFDFDPRQFTPVDEWQFESLGLT